MESRKKSRRARRWQRQNAGGRQETHAEKVAPQNAGAMESERVDLSVQWLSNHLFCDIPGRKSGKARRKFINYAKKVQQRLNKNTREGQSSSKNDSNLSDMSKVHDPTRKAYSVFGKETLGSTGRESVFGDECQTAVPFREWLGEMSPEAKFFTCKLINALESGKISPDKIQTVSQLRTEVWETDLRGIEYPEGVPGKTVVRCTKQVYVPAHSIAEVEIGFDQKIVEMSEWSVDQCLIKGVDIPDRAISCSRSGETLMLVNTSGTRIKVREGQCVASMFLLKNMRLLDFMKDESPKVPILSDIELTKVVSKIEEVEGQAIFTKLDRAMPESSEFTARSCSSIRECCSSTLDEGDSEELYVNCSRDFVDAVDRRLYYEEVMDIDAIGKQQSMIDPQLEKIREYDKQCRALFKKMKKPTAEEARKVLETIKTYKKERRDIFEAKLKPEDPRIQKVFYDHYDLFDGDLPNQWNALRIKPIKLPLVERPPDQIKPAYRSVFDERQMEVIEDFIITSLARKIIRKSTSNFMSNIHLVKRPEITPGVPRPMRLTIDYRKVNQKAMASAPHPIPDISDVTMRLGNKRIFTSVDISNAYWRAPLHENSKKWTGFILNQGHLAGAYEWNYIPFGLKTRLRKTIFVI